MGRRLREVDLGAWTGLDRADAKTRLPHEYELAVDDTARGEERAPVTRASAPPKVGCAEARPTTFTALAGSGVPDRRSVRHISVHLASGAHLGERRTRLKFEVPRNLPGRLQNQTGRTRPLATDGSSPQCR